MLQFFFSFQTFLLQAGKTDLQINSISDPERMHSACRIFSILPTKAKILFKLSIRFPIIVWAALQFMLY